MIFAPERHEALAAVPWDAARARDCIARIAAGAEDAFAPGAGWPTHPQDAADPAPQDSLYFGACGVIWALHHLQARGAVTLRQDYAQHLAGLRAPAGEEASYLFGETAPLLLRLGLQPAPELADRLAALVAGNLEHPARELMWGSPGTLLAAWFLHERTGEPRWGELFLRTARQLWSELVWSPEERCRYWTQDLYGRRSTYLDGVHGFVATAAPLVAGRALLPPQEWQAWQDCITETVTRTAEWEGGLANWRAHLTGERGKPKLMQYCHGAPGFVICLADSPDSALDPLLRAAGEAVWAAGPLRKGSNLCHGTGGNGYAFLKLHRRFGEEPWLERARAFAMHGIAQTEQALAQHGQWRHSLWTGDPGFAVYLLDCIEGRDRFPTLDVFWA